MMQNNKRKLRTLEPTVVPAYPGFKVAAFSAPGENPVTQDMKPGDLWLGYDPVIAWSIQHVVELDGSDNYVTAAHVVPITPEGILDDHDPYLVSADGKWSKPGDQDFASEIEARQHYIAQQTRRSNRAK